ncbi:hypothetical protein [Hydrogenophaga sp.]|nr:hypothetical protein [Hydrogenophaga sp.]
MLAVLGLVLGLSACGQPTPQAALKVGLSNWVGHDPLVLAREQGFTDAGN